jgi:hypothetical protein
MAADRASTFVAKSVHPVIVDKNTKITFSFVRNMRLP